MLLVSIIISINCRSFPERDCKGTPFFFHSKSKSKFFAFFWNYFSPQQSPQRNSLKNSALSQISTEGIFFINFYFLNNFVTKSSNKRKSQQAKITTNANHNKRKSQQVQIATSIDCNKYRLQQKQMGAIIQYSTPLRSLYP